MNHTRSAWRWLAPVIVASVLALALLLSAAGYRWAYSAPLAAPGTPAVQSYLPLVARIAPTPTPAPSDTTSSQFGLAFINSAESPASTTRIQRGVATGARYDRFPLYWSNIEARAGQFTWSPQDAAIAADEGQGLSVIGLLLGTPGQYFPPGRSAVGFEPPIVGGSFVRNAGKPQLSGSCTSGQPVPTGLAQPIYTDGSDKPGAGKSINPGNPWARFVDAIVSRYMPGGAAQRHIRVWEIWNEPDLCQFWAGSATEYARLLKVAYLVIKNRDPQATVLWGGLAYYEQPGFRDGLINALRSDPMAASYNGLFDGAAGHQYAVSWNGYLWTSGLRSALDAAGWAGKPIWVTESGVPVCNDFPGPPCPSPWRATPEEQASFIWQNIGYTRLAGGGPILQFNLHDDCGNIVAPNSPDGFGLVKNESGSYCSPDGATPRLSYTAFQLANRYFPGTELLWGIVQNTTVARVAFYDPASHERRLLAWNLTTAATTSDIPATGTQARLIALDGSQQTLTPANGVYRLSLPGATNRNQPDNQGGYAVGIYGKPSLLIEQDTLPPTASIGNLPATSPSSFTVSWQASDLGSGVQGVAVWYQPGDGAWVRWLDRQPAGGSAVFTGQVGQRYRFAALGTDRAGNTATNLTSQAETLIGSAAPSQAAVSGQVVDVRGQPAAGAAVAIGLVSGTTDGSGRYSLSVPLGRWDVRTGGHVVSRGQLFQQDTGLNLLLQPGQNAVANGDFENSLANWQKGGSCPSGLEVQTNTEDHALRLATSFVPNPGVPGEEGSNGGNSTVQQALHLPAGHPYLALHYRVDSQETSTGHDDFEIIVVQGSTAHYLLVQQLASNWAYRSFDLSAYAGSDVTLIFNVYQKSPNRPTSALIDLVSIGVP